jgi:hypothetical protein
MTMKNVFATSMRIISGSCFGLLALVCAVAVLGRSFGLHDAWVSAQTTLGSVLAVMPELAPFMLFAVGAYFCGSIAWVLLGPQRPESGPNGIKAGAR